MFLRRILVASALAFAAAQPATAQTLSIGSYATFVQIDPFTALA